MLRILFSSLKLLFINLKKNCISQFPVTGPYVNWEFVFCVQLEIGVVIKMWSLYWSCTTLTPNVCRWNEDTNMNVIDVWCHEHEMNDPAITYYVAITLLQSLTLKISGIQCNVHIYFDQIYVISIQMYLLLVNHNIVHKKD